MERKSAVAYELCDLLSVVQALCGHDRRTAYPVDLILSPDVQAGIFRVLDSAQALAWQLYGADLAGGEAGLDGAAYAAPQGHA